MKDKVKFKSVKSDMLEEDSPTIHKENKNKAPETVITLDDVKYEIKLLPASDGIVMAKEIVKLVSPVLGSLVDGTRTHAEFGDATVFTDAALYLCSQLDKADVLEMIYALLNNLKVNGVEVEFDEAFKANYGNLVEVVKFAMEGNFSSFFSSKALTKTASDFMTLLSKATQEESQGQSSESKT